MLSLSLPLAAQGRGGIEKGGKKKKEGGRKMVVIGSTTGSYSIQYLKDTHISPQNLFIF